MIYISFDLCIFSFADVSLIHLITTFHNEVKRELKELNSKLDFALTNQEKLCRYILPSDKVIKRPTGFPSLPVQSEEELNALEAFLSNDVNLSAAVSFSLCVLAKSNDYVSKKLRNFIFSFAEYISWKIC